MFVKTPRLYCLIREDIQDLNPGKAAAQAMHAQSLASITFDNNHPALEEWIQWLDEGKGFGTTICLSVMKADLEDLAPTPISGVVIDPTYPWKNFYGQVFTTPEITCGWYFRCSMSTNEELEHINSLELYR